MVCSVDFSLVVIVAVWRFGEKIMHFYHGTSLTNANNILAGGFKRSDVPSFTGTGVNLTECMTISYEYGGYEGGAILKCEVSQSANIIDHDSYRDLDDFFKANPHIDGVSLYGGNVVVIWNADVITKTEIMKADDITHRLHEEFEGGGPNMAYNGNTQDQFEVFCEAKGWEC